MAALFLKGTKRMLQNFLGIGYGFLCIEDCEMMLVTHIEQGMNILRDGVEKGFIRAKEMKACEQAMVKANLPKNLADLFNTIRRFKLQDFVPSMQFELCTTCGLPLPHGFVRDMDKGGEKIMSFVTSVEAFMNLDEAVREDKVTAPYAVKIMKQVLEAKLADDKEDLEKLAEALPPEVKETLRERRGVRTSSVSVPGLGSATMIEIPISGATLNDLLGRGRRDG